MDQLLRDYQPVIADEGVAGRNDSFLAAWGERKVCCSCVAAIEGPFCFAVADDEAARGGHYSCNLGDQLRE